MVNVMLEEKAEQHSAESLLIALVNLVSLGVGMTC
jgi:hypothetical protein